MKGLTYRKIEGDNYDVPEPKRRYLPRIDFTLEDLPEAKDWEVGSTYEVAIKVKQIGLRLDGSDDSSEGNATFEIVGVKVLNSKDPNKKVSRYNNSNES